MKKLFTIIILALAVLTMQAQTIYEIQGQAAVSPYDGQIVTTSGIVTAVFSVGYFIQDGEGEWNGIYVYSGDDVERGDLVQLTAEVDEYYTLTELKNVSAIEILSSGNALPEPAALSTAAVNDEAWESVLVKVENAICTDPDLGFGEWQLDDGSGPCRIDDLGFAYTPDEGISYSVTGPLYFSFDFYKIEPRDAADIQILEALYFVQQPEQINPTPASVTITWETNVEATTEAYFGLTPELELGHMEIAGTGTQHQIDIPLVFGSLIYYIRPFSVAGNDTTPDFTRPYAVVSNSTGEVKLYFNHPVDDEAALIEPATYAPNITDTVISWIGKAQQTLDIAMYEQESEDIVEAVNQAHDRGVVVRYITDDIGNNPALDGLNPEIPVLYGNTDAIMHNKFIIIDEADEMNAWVITGSLNHTENNLGWDFNNMICIQDQSLAKAFVLEFEEMWGSDNAVPDPANARFGADKTDNTPHKFLIGGIPMELYFSPSDHTTQEIVDVLDQAENEAEFGIMVFTENSLGDAVLDAHNRGLDMRGIIDYVEYTGSEYDYLKNNGVNVLNYTNPDGSSWPDGPVFHHKYLITDFTEGTENAVLVTGSHNWSASAESVNDENTLIIHDLNLANQFHQEFNRRYDEQLTPVAVSDDTITQEDTQVNIDFLANDYIPETITAIHDLVEQPLHGTAAIDLPYIAYVPQDGFNGTDSLSYRLVNSERPELADTAWVHIQVGETGIAEDLDLYGFSFDAVHSANGMIRADIKSGGNQSAMLKLYDRAGSLIASKDLKLNTGTNTVSIRPPAQTGVYILELTGERGKLGKKILVR